MRSRQLVCNDSRVQKLLEGFVPAADNPGRYRNFSNTPRAEALEYRLLHGALTQTGFRASMNTWHVQGMYVITPSGKVIAGGNRPMNLDATLADMRKGLEAYAAMPKSERLLARAPDPTMDRMSRDRPRPPSDGLVLRCVARGLDENVVYDQCVLAPEFYHIDRLWYTREEAMQFLPPDLRRGARKEVNGPVLDGMARLYLMASGAGSHFDEEHLKERRLNSEVVDIAGNIVNLRLTGRVVSAADNDIIRKKYKADLLGYLTYDTAQKKFTRFDLLAYGKHNLANSDTRPDASPFMTLGILFTLNGLNVNDNQPPTKLGLYRWVKLQAGRD